MEEQPPYGDGFPKVELIDPDNVEPRVACVLLLDTSGSMEGEKIKEVNAGLKVFHEDLNADRLASKRAEIAIVTFGGVVETLRPFFTADLFTPPTLTTSGQTPMGEAIRRGIEMVTERKELYRALGILYYRPWIFLITDGFPTDEWESAARMVHKGEANSSFSFYAVGVEGAEMDTLNAIAVPSRPAIKLKGNRFREMFQWLSKSITAVARSQPEDQVPFPPPGWGGV